MADGGHLQLQISWNGERVVAAAVRSSRPAAARLLPGRSLDEVVALVPRLFSLCGQAQAAAASLAAAAARGGDWQRDSAFRLRQVLLEALGEHLWRLLLDWPAALGQAARRADFVRWRQRLLAAGQSSEAAAHCAGELLEWLHADAPFDPSALATWVMPDPAASVALLPRLDAAAWAKLDFSDAFSSRPEHAGQICETGALARQSGEKDVAAALAAGQRLLARLLARLADLRALAQLLARARLPDGWLDAASPSPGVGVARVETARGLLLHMTQVNDDRVGRYVIVAPTEWNFHPQGAFVREASATPLASAEAATCFARQLALALDPCVAFEVQLEVVKDA